MINHLEKLCALDGVSGHEDAVRDYILEQIIDLADDFTVDGSGSVVAFKKGETRPKSRVMLAAHMDEVGLIITSVTSEGLLKFDTVGGINTQVLCGRTVLIGAARLPGVIGLPPIHLCRSGARGKCPEKSSLTIDIGAQSREEAEMLVRPGDVCVFDTQFERMGDGMLKGRALDDRAGCAVLLDIMRSELPCDMWFAFTTMEEVGLRGAGCAAFSAEPDAAVVIEATTAADVPFVERERQVCRLGDGAVVGFMDNRTIYDRGMYDMALKIAAEKNIPVQVKQAVAGGNDAGAISRSRAGVRTLAVSVPCRYLHSPAGLISQEDLGAVRELACELARQTAQMTGKEA